MLPKKGKKFPKQDGEGSAALGYAGTVATALREELGDTHQAIKTVMNWTGACERTAKNWLAGTRGPAGEHLILLLQNSDAVLESVLRLAGRASSVAAINLIDARIKLVEMLKNFDELLDQDRSHHVPGT
jgi:hypothetical protein